MSKVTFSKDFMLNILDSDNVIENKLVDTSRWALQYELIFEHEGKFYRTYYQVGATEYQDEGPWEFDDEVNCEEVIQKEVLIKPWVTV